MRSRPLGITILSVLLFLNSAGYAVLCMLSIVNRRVLAAVLQGLSPGGAGPAAMQLSMGRSLTVYYIVLLAITGALAMGFWRLLNWARMVALALIGVSLIAAAIELFSLVRSPSGSASLVVVARVAVSVLISVLIGWYLVSAKVRAAFRPSATSAYK